MTHFSLPGFTFVDHSEILFQFRIENHVLGFRTNSVVVAAGDHMLMTSFVNAEPITPVSMSRSMNTESLEKVVYASLWDGITLSIENAPGRVCKSSYLIEPGADPSHILLRYNVPVEVDARGNLNFHYQTGYLSESAPVAWQEIDHRYNYVDVSFERRGDREVGFALGDYDPTYPLIIDPTLTWNTFMGSSDWDGAYDIAMDGDGNVYVVGKSNATWGSPKRTYTGDYDAFVSKLKSDGSRVWNTFLGSSNTDVGNDIVIDDSFHLYVCGSSESSWGSPVNAHYGNGVEDAFAAELDSSGSLIWNTFMGSWDDEIGHGLFVSAEGDSIYMIGESGSTWGIPKTGYEFYPSSSSSEAFLCKMNGNGTRQWHLFMGGTGFEYGHAVTQDDDGYLYTVGSGFSSSWSTTWGSPVRAHAGGSDAFITKHRSNGDKEWFTFLGSSGVDSGDGIAVDDDGNLFLAGYSELSWGNPVHPNSGWDAFAAKLNGNGVLQWNTFWGSNLNDYGFDIGIDPNGLAYVTGYDSWGSDTEFYVCSLNGKGGIALYDWPGTDSHGYGLVVDGSNTVYVAGVSWSMWDSPVNAFEGNRDGFASRFNTMFVYENSPASRSY